MMNDRELLEDAAKAIGGEYDWMTESITFDRGITYDQWEPLSDDGDVLRLAVKLGLNIIQQHTLSGPEPVAAACGYCADDYKITSVDYADCNNDSLAATRRTIVLAAAEIGKNK